MGPRTLGDVLLVQNLPEPLSTLARRAIWTSHKEHLPDPRAPGVHLMACGCVPMVINVDEGPWWQQLLADLNINRAQG